ncbi:MAG: T9SS type A sorting domain-containing protein, partial [Sphingobacteriales bacterium]
GIAPSCGAATTIIIGQTSNNLSITYQLRNNTNDENVGNSVSGITGSAINLNTGSLTTASVFNVLVTNAITGCKSELTNLASVAISGVAAPATNTLTSGIAPSCGAATTIIIGQTSNNLSITYQLLNTTTNTYIGTPVSATGTTLELATDEILEQASYKAVRTSGGCPALTSAEVLIECELSPLPVKLVSFKASLQKDEVLVSWVTASEIDNDYFEVEKSLDGKNFEAIGKIAGKGTDFGRNSYSFTDNRPAAGINYYRLRQVDLDGKFTLSHIAAVQLNSNLKELVTVFPNPVTDRFTLTAENFAAGNYSLELYDVYGHLIISQTLKIGSGPATDEVKVSGLPGGMYMLRISGNNQHIIQQIVKN